MKRHAQMGASGPKKCDRGLNGTTLPPLRNPIWRDTGNPYPKGGVSDSVGSALSTRAPRSLKRPFPFVQSDWHVPSPPVRIAPWPLSTCPAALFLFAWTCVADFTEGSRPLCCSTRMWDPPA